MAVTNKIINCNLKSLDMWPMVRENIQQTFILFKKRSIPTQGKYLHLLIRMKNYYKINSTLPSLNF